MSGPAFLPQGRFPWGCLATGPSRVGDAWGSQCIGALAHGSDSIPLVPWAVGKVPEKVGLLVLVDPWCSVIVDSPLGWMLLGKSLALVLLE